MTDHPNDNLVRSLGDTRAKAAGDGHTLYGHFAVFDTWTEIHSFFEGDFLERIAPGAFAKTIQERRDQIKVLYDHGGDPQLGNKPLGAITALREDKVGAYYEVDLLNRPYVDDIAAAASAGLLGSSFRFKVTAESWSTPDKPSADNPQMLDERTINAVDLYEFGPVTFPAYSEASASMRSRTDEFLDRFLKDPWFVARFTERAGLAVEDVLQTLPSPTQEEREETEPPAPDDEAAAGAETCITPRARRQWWAQRLKETTPR